MNQRTEISDSKKVLQAWENIVFSSPAMSDVSQLSLIEQRSVARRQTSSLLKLFGEGYNNGGWRISASAASAIAISIWYRAMFMEDYALAHTITRTLLEHKELEPKEDRFEAELDMIVAQMNQRPDEEAILRLARFSKEAISSSWDQTREIVRALLVWFPDVIPNSSEFSALTNLVKLLASGNRRLQRRAQRICSRAKSISDLQDALAVMLGFR